MPVYRNASWVQRIAPRDGATHNLTGVTLRMQIRAKAGSGSALVELTTANGGITLIDATKGIFDLHITKTQAATLPAGLLAFDIVRTDTDARLFGGRIKVEEGVTV